MTLAGYMWRRIKVTSGISEPIRHVTGKIGEFVRNMHAKCGEDTYLCKHDMLRGLGGGSERNCHCIRHVRVRHSVYTCA